MVKENEGITEIDPGKVGNNTEVDLDNTKIENYPNERPEEQSGT